MRVAALSGAGESWGCQGGLRAHKRGRATPATHTRRCLRLASRNRRTRRCMRLAAALRGSLLLLPAVRCPNRLARGAPRAASEDGSSGNWSGSCMPRAASPLHRRLHLLVTGCAVFEASHGPAAACPATLLHTVPLAVYGCGAQGNGPRETALGRASDVALTATPRQNYGHGGPLRRRAAAGDQQRALLHVPHQMCVAVDASPGRQGSPEGCVVPPRPPPPDAPLARPWPPCSLRPGRVGDVQEGGGQLLDGCVPGPHGASQGGPQPGLQTTSCQATPRPGRPPPRLRRLTPTCLPPHQPRRWTWATTRSTGRS